MSSFNLDLETNDLTVKDDFFVEDDGFSENSEDNRWTEQQKREVGNAVVFSTDWTTETIIN
ncbi:TPA: hypothetical protein ACRRX3_000530 [Morganella morganii]